MVKAGKIISRKFLRQAFINGKNLIVKGLHGNHVFLDYRFFRVLINRITAIHQSESKLRQSQAIHLHNLLAPLTFDTAWIKTHSNPKYCRRVGKDIDVLDPAGSLSDGGRYNIGGAQTSSTAVKQFGNLGKKKSALYLGEDARIVREEYGDDSMPGSTAMTYTVTTLTKDLLNLIEMDAVLISLTSAIPDINALIGTPAMNGTWVDIKSPAPSQILGHWLRLHAPDGTQGIRFISAYDHGYNICLFFQDARECTARLIAAAN